MSPSERVDPKRCAEKDPRYQLCETIQDIAILQAYARSAGKRIPDKVLDDLARLSDWVIAAEAAERLAGTSPRETPAPPAGQAPATPESGGEESSTTPPPTSTTPPPAVQSTAPPSIGVQLKVALGVHGQLSELVAPATVRSLKATDPGQSLFSWVAEVWAIPLILVITVFAFLALVTAQARLAERKAEANAAAVPQTPSEGKPSTETKPAPTSPPPTDAPRGRLENWNLPALAARHEVAYEHERELH